MRHEIAPNTPTGVVKGRWKRDIVVDLFSRHGIEVDFTRRGFHDPGKACTPHAPLVRRLADRVRSLW